MEPKIYFPSEFPKLTTERLELSLPRLADANELFELRSDPSFMKYIGKHPMKELSEAEDYIQQIHGQFNNKQGVVWKLSPKGSNLFIGYIGFWQINYENHRIEIGYGLHQKHQGQGFMKEAMKALVSYAFQKLNAHSITAEIDPFNNSSRQLLISSGFQKEAYIRENFYFNGEFTDSEHYGLIQRDL